MSLAFLASIEDDAVEPRSEPRIHGQRWDWCRENFEGGQVGIAGGVFGGALI